MTDQSRAVRGFGVAFLLAHALVPFMRQDLYPFSAFPMFSEGRLNCLTRLSVTDEAKHPVDAVSLGLYVVPIFNPRPEIGCMFDPPPLRESNDRSLLSPTLSSEVGKKLCEKGLGAVVVSEEKVCVRQNRVQTEVVGETRINAQCGQ